MGSWTDRPPDLIEVTDLAQRFAVDPDVDLSILKILRRITAHDDGGFWGDPAVVWRALIELPRALEIGAVKATDVR